MARRTFPEGFKEKAIAYPAEHPELSMKRCAEDLGIGYSTLRRWLDEAAEETQNAALPKNLWRLKLWKLLL